jgi:PKD repeat protein
MKTKHIILSFLISLISTVYSQNEMNNWYFGEYAGITFNTTPPSAISGGIYQREGCSSISDANGNLLFYSSGQSIYDATHNVMNNGGWLNGSHMSAQASLIVPKPLNSTQYYVFTINDWTMNSSGLSYSIVDMNLNNGLGDVVQGQKNVQVNLNVREQLAAVYHDNCKDVWIICHEGGMTAASNNNYIAYLLTDQGLQTTPVVSSTGMTYSGSNRYGSIKFSKDGSMLCSALGTNSNYTGTTVELYDFDNATGIISNPVFIADNTQAPRIFSSEFSPDNSKLYIASYVDNYIYQYDISSGNSSTIGASMINIAPINGFRRAVLQIGPDDKIYVSRPQQPYLGVIHSPNNSGAGCGYIDNGILLTGTADLGLPNFVQGCGGYSNTTSCQAAFTSAITCDSVMFTDNSTATGTASVVSWSWDLGDGTTSNQQSPNHTYTSNGTYYVCLSITTSDSCTSNYCEVVQYNCIPTPCQADYNAYLDTTNCYTMYFYDNSTSSGNILSWYWDFGDGNSAQQQYAGNTYSADGIYTVCLSIMTADSCMSTYCDTISINCNSPSQCQANFAWADTACNVAFYNMSTITQNEQYLWDFGDGSVSGLKNPTHTYSSSGTYQVILAAFDSINPYCFDTVSYFVTVNCGPASTCQAGFYPYIDTVNCFSAYFYNNSTASSNILAWNWSFGDGNMSSLQHPTHIYTANGTYTVCLNIVAADGCTSTYCDTIVISCVTTSPCQANFTATLDTSAGNNMTFNFIDQSTSPTPIIYQLWDYGDGNLTTLPNPTYTYANSGSYQVCLTILTLDSCISHYCDSVYVGMTSSINDIFKEGKLSIFPNPANSTVQVTFDVLNGQEYDLAVFNVTGQTVRRMHDHYNGAVKIGRNELPKGLYFIEVEVNGQINRGKLIFK